MEGIKEDLFQIELEHQQGRISQSEYERAKAALDQTLARALKLQTQEV
jgi:outer membrane protein TolC